MILKIGKRPYFRSLAATLTISFSVLTMIALLIASSLQMYFSYKTQKDLLIKNQRLIAKNTANTVENFISEKCSLLELTSKHRDLLSFHKEEQKLLMERLLGLEPAFRQLALFDSEQSEAARVSHFSKSLSPELMKYDDTELFSSTARKEIYRGPVYIDEITRMPMMVIAVPVTDIFNDYKGSLIAELNLKVLWDLVYQFKIGMGGDVYVVEEHGYLIAYKDISRVLKREKPDHITTVKHFIEKGKSSNKKIKEISKGINNTYVITTNISLKTLKWSVIVEQPIMVAYRPIFMTLLLSGLAMFFSIVLAIISGVYLSRKLINPVIELRDATEKIGKGELSLKIDIDSKNEIAELAVSFNRMVEDLKNTTVSRDTLLSEIEERKHVEQVLLDSEQKMKAILMASPIGIGLVQGDKLEWANESFFSMFGYEENDILGKSISVLFSGDDDFRRVTERLFSDTGVSRPANVEVRCIRKDDVFIDCIMGACPLDASDLSRGQIITFIDISESKRLQAKLLRAQKMEVIGTLSAGVAHDLNNILGGIVGYPELLLLDMAEDNPMRDPLLMIKKTGERAAAIVKELLTMARREIAINEVVNLHDIIDEFMKSPEYESILTFHPGTDIKVDLRADRVNILGSGAKLSKVLMNLISNAAEAMPEGGNIRITTENKNIERPVSGYENIDEGDYITLTVSDTGEGISNIDLKKIFEPFYTKKKMGRSGTGLGMTVVWGTVKDHAGFIDVISQEGKGSKFILYFPLTKGDVIEKKSPETPGNYMGNGESVLIVDDVEEQRILLTRILDKLDYRITSVSSGEEAVSYMKNNSADLIVLDMIMDPGINGLETYKRILEIHPNQKAIIASGFSETEHVKETLKLGASAYIQKPYNLDRIGRVIRDALSN